MTITNRTMELPWLGHFRKSRRNLPKPFPEPFALSNVPCVSRAQPLRYLNVFTVISSALAAELRLLVVLSAESDSVKVVVFWPTRSRETYARLSRKRRTIRHQLALPCARSSSEKLIVSLTSMGATIKFRPQKLNPPSLDYS